MPCPDMAGRTIGPVFLMSKRSQHVLLVIAAVSVVAIASLFVVEDAMTWLGGLVQKLMTALISLGKAIAGVAGDSGSASLALFLFGNFVMTCIILLTTRLHSFTKGKKRPAHLAIASATLFAGLSLMIIQTGFCQGFPPNVVGEWLTDISKVLMGLEGLIISFVPFYFAMQSRTKRPLRVRGSDVG